MDDYDDYGRGPSRPQTFVLPTAPRAALGPDIADDRIPREPPFTAYIANLSYDIDEEEIMEFFSKLRIKGVRLPRDGGDDPASSRLKGFGYADFEDRESLIEALAMNEQLLKNRKLRVDLATSSTQGGGFGGAYYIHSGELSKLRSLVSYFNFLSFPVLPPQVVVWVAVAGTATTAARTAPWATGALGRRRNPGEGTATTGTEGEGTGTEVRKKWGERDT